MQAAFSDGGNVLSSTQGYAKRRHLEAFSLKEWLAFDGRR